MCSQAGEFKRTLTPFKKIDRKDVEKTEQEIGEIFSLFKVGAPPCEPPTRGPSSPYVKSADS